STGAATGAPGASTDAPTPTGEAATAMFAPADSAAPAIPPTAAPTSDSLPRSPSIKPSPMFSPNPANTFDGDSIPSATSNGSLIHPGIILRNASPIVPARDL